MIIMMAVSGENVWTEQEGRDMTPADLLGILIDNEVDETTAYTAIGSALVHGNSNIYTKDGVISVSII